MTLTGQYAMRPTAWLPVLVAAGWLCAAGPAPGATATNALAAGQTGYWTDNASWNTSPYPGSAPGESAYLANSVAGSYRNILDTTLGFAISTLAISNVIGEAWLVVTNATLTDTTLRVGPGGRLQVDNNGQATVTTVSLLGSDPALYLNSGGRLTTGAQTVFNGVSGNAALISSASGAGPAGMWTLGGGALTVGWGGATGNVLTIANRVALTNLASLALGGVQQGVVLTNGAVVFQSGGGPSLSAGSRILVTAGSRLSMDASGAASMSWNGNDGLLQVSGTNSVFEGRTPGGNGTHMFIGFGTSRNTLRVENGGVVTGLNVIVGYPNTGNATNNLLSITGGGRMYSKILPSYIGFASVCNTGIVAGAGSLWDLGAGPSDHSVWGGGGLNMSGRSNVLLIADGGVVTNIGVYDYGDGYYGLYVGRSDANAFANQVIVTNGGRLFCAGNFVSYVGGAAGCQSNRVTVTGSGSLWDLMSGSLTVGGNPAKGAVSTGNVLRIDQGGTVDNVGALSVETNNMLYLNGGTLGVGAVTLKHGALFTVGDGAQPAALSSLGGGTCNFTNGLLVNPGGTLRGAGPVVGGPLGVIITNGATFSGGVSGPGTLALGNTTWHGNATNLVEITDVAGVTGVDFDTVNISTQLTLNANGGKFVIRMDSLGGDAGFQANQNYDLKILSYGSSSAIDTNDFVLDLSRFVPGGNWRIENRSKALWLVYAGAPPIAADWVWNAPNNGFWGTSGNWTNPGVPAAGGNGNWTLKFGGSGGTPYYAANNQTNAAGEFALNRLLLESSGAATNIIGGATLAFAGAEAGIVQQGFGAFQITNRLAWSGPVSISGYGAGDVLLGGILAGTGAVSVAAKCQVTLSANNTFAGDVSVACPGEGRLRVTAANALGANHVTVGTGTLEIAVTYKLGDTNEKNRRGVVTGAKSFWNNSGSFYVGGAAGATNNSLLVTQTGTFSAATLYVGDGSPGFNSLIVSNGGRVVAGSSFLGASSSNNTIRVAGAGSVFNAGVLTMAGTSNRLWIDQGGVATSMTFRTPAASVANTLVVTNGGVVYGSVSPGGNGGRVLVTGPGALVTAGGNIGNDGGTNNELRIENGGAVIGMMKIGGVGPANPSPCSRMVVDNATWSGGGLYVGAGVETSATTWKGTYSNEVVATNGAQLTASSLGVYVGGYVIYGTWPHITAYGTNNLLKICSGSTLRCGPAGTPGPLEVGYWDLCYGNQVLVDSGTVTSVSALNVGDGLTNVANSVVITNGGLLTLDGASGARIGVGAASYGNAIGVFTGGVLNARGYPVTIGVGAGSWSNRLIVGGGVVTNVGTLTVGLASTASTNSVYVYGGGMLSAAALTVNAGGQIDVDVTNPGFLSAVSVNANGIVNPVNLPRSGKKTVTVLTAGSLTGNLVVGPLPAGYSGTLTTYLATSPKRVDLNLKGPSVGTVVILR